MAAGLRTRLRDLVLGGPPIPETRPVGLRSPQDLVQIQLHGLGSPIDVTENGTLAALHPLTMVLGFDAARAHQLEEAGRVSLHFVERPTGTTLARIDLRVDRRIEHDGAHFCLLEPVRLENRCMPWPRMQMHYAYQAWQQRKRRHRWRLTFTPRDVQGVQVYYTCPQPVVLVSVASGGVTTMFPMDLVGPTATPYFLLALRTTSRALELMDASGRLALAGVPLEQKEVAYALGEFHRGGTTDWTVYETAPSPAFGLPVLAGAVDVLELRIERSLVVGSHRLFITRPEGYHPWAGGAQLHHLQGFYKHRLDLHGWRQGPDGFYRNMSG